MGISRRGKKGLFQHFRRVPKRFAGIEPRALIRTALHTTDKNIANAKAAKIENLQDAAWEATLAGRDVEAEQQYEQLRALAEVRGVSYLPADLIAEMKPSEIVQRVEDIEDIPVMADALLGRIDTPGLSLLQLLETYQEFIADQLLDKSSDQLRRWKAPREKAIKNLISVIGDQNIRDITRDDGLRFRKWWWRRIETGKLSANSGNKDITYLSAMVNTVAKMNSWVIDNPFVGLRFKEVEHQRVPFSVDWIMNNLLAKTAFEGLNSEARDVFLTMINTGARPSEIIGLKSAHICLDENVPKIKIRSEGRALKTKYSERDIPLVGVSLEAMRRNPDGFLRYRDKATTWSNTVTKYMRENDLLETPKHSAYSLRHSLSDRLLNAGCEDRVRKEILGHRPETIIYGAGSSLETRLEWLGRVAL